MGVYVFFLILFGLLGYLAYQSLDFPGDITISLWLQRMESPFFTRAMTAISFLASTIPAAVIVTLVVIGLVATRRKLEPIFVASVPGLAALLNWGLKSLINRPRPGNEIIQVLAQSNGPSFPSGHTVFAVVCYGLLFYLMPTLTKQRVVVGTVRTVLLLLIVFTGVSRIYLGAHWPSDVLGGFLLGGLLLFPSIALYNNYARRRRLIMEDNLARTA